MLKYHKCTDLYHVKFPRYRWFSFQTRSGQSLFQLHPRRAISVVSIALTFGFALCSLLRPATHRQQHVVLGGTRHPSQVCRILPASTRELCRVAS